MAILLATFNGERHLSRQLDSVLMQDHQNWVIFASDDGSSDRTLSILDEFRAKAGPDRLVLLKGPQAGYAANFVSLLHRPSVTGDFYAFCDQDDWWEPNKLSRALEWARQQPADIPALYCGRTRLIDVDERSAGYSQLFMRKPGFRNALAQSLAGGNTMLLNAATRELMMQAPEGLPVTSHDWWAYLVVTGCGGNVHYDAVPTVGYRQHEGNLIGSNAGVRSRLDRLKKMLWGSYKIWNDINLTGLDALETKLTQDNRRILALFKDVRSTWVLKRLWSLARSGIYRQTMAGNLGMVLAVMLRRF
ncbi:MAG TPA: glycosyltransferase family 2 protein [Rhodocyclaceae bacterium]|nr:glycosyltransferase family 2 protein [Rhodocyclaceae bacterium]